MQLSTHERIPNHALSGTELRDYALFILRNALRQHVVLSELQIQEVLAIFAVDMANDYVFGPSTMYPNASMTFEFHSHLSDDRWSFDLKPHFQFTNPSNAQHVVFIHRPTSIPKPPLPPLNDPQVLVEEHVVDCFRLECTVDNPNLVRVHTGMPILITRSIMPDRAKQKPMVTFETQEIHFEASQYEPLPPPRETDLSRQKAKEWGLQGDIEFPTEGYRQMVISGSVDPAPEFEATVTVNEIAEPDRATPTPPPAPDPPPPPPPSLITATDTGRREALHKLGARKDARFTNGIPEGWHGEPKKRTKT
jgi:hypothetical protein